MSGVRIEFSAGGVRKIGVVLSWSVFPVPIASGSIIRGAARESFGLGLATVAVCAVVDPAGDCDRVASVIVDDTVIVLFD